MDGGEELKTGCWTQEEDQLLAEWQAKLGNKWSVVARHIPGRNGQQCAQRWRHKVNPHIKREKWTAEEDQKLAELVAMYGNKWAEIARQCPGRTDQQCMGRWRRHLDPSIRRDSWTREEDRKLQLLYDQHKSQWSLISASINGRTAQQCRARWFQMQARAADEEPIGGPAAPRRGSSGGVTKRQKTAAGKRVAAAARTLLSGRGGRLAGAGAAADDSDARSSSQAKENDTDSEVGEGALPRNACSDVGSAACAVVPVSRLLGPGARGSAGLKGCSEGPCGGGPMEEEGPGALATPPRQRREEDKELLMPQGSPERRMQRAGAGVCKQLSPLLQVAQMRASEMDGSAFDSLSDASDELVCGGRRGGRAGEEQGRVQSVAAGRRGAAACAGPLLAGAGPPSLPSLAASSERGSTATAGAEGGGGATPPGARAVLTQGWLCEPLPHGKQWPRPSLAQQGASPAKDLWMSVQGLSSRLSTPEAVETELLDDMTTYEPAKDSCMGATSPELRLPRDVLVSPKSAKTPDWHESFGSGAGSGGGGAAAAGKATTPARAAAASARPGARCSIGCGSGADRRPGSSESGVARRLDMHDTWDAAVEDPLASAVLPTSTAAAAAAAPCRASAAAAAAASSGLLDVGRRRPPSAHSAVKGEGELRDGRPRPDCGTLPGSGWASSVPQQLCSSSSPEQDDFAASRLQARGSGGGCALQAPDTSRGEAARDLPDPGLSETRQRLDNLLATL